jgi:hypothetical protein
MIRQIATILLLVLASLVTPIPRASAGVTQFTVNHTALLVGHGSEVGAVISGTVTSTDATVRIRLTLTQGSGVLTAVQQGAVTLSGAAGSRAWSVTTSPASSSAPAGLLLPGRARVRVTVESFDAGGRPVHFLLVETQVTLIP